MKQIVIFLSLIYASFLLAQDVQSDSLKTRVDITNIQTLPDSLYGPLQTDSLQAQKKKSDLEGPIKYKAKKITLSDNGNTIRPGQPRFTGRRQQCCLY
ncbi:MAG: hypothetical protein P8X42_14320 [Calditrichaceae bacterium]